MPTRINADQAAIFFDYLAYLWLKGPVDVDDLIKSLWTREIAGSNLDLAEVLDLHFKQLSSEEDTWLANENYINSIYSYVPNRYVPPYASIYLDRERTLWGSISKETLKYYNALELDFNSNTSSYPQVKAPDHIGVEFAFMAELLNASNSSDAINLATEFLNRHLLQWVPNYLEDLRKKLSSPYWISGANLCELLLNSILK